MSDRQVLFYFTDSWPYGMGESWKTNELNILSRYFTRVFVVPLWYNDNRHPVRIPGDNIQVLDPPFEKLCNCLRWSDLLLLLKSEVLREAIGQGAIFCKSRLKACLLFAKFAAELKRTPVFRFISENCTANTVWYFFWARGWADILPFIDKPMVKRVALRMHGYDLYLERNGGYIPFRHNVFEKADILLPVSDVGRNYLLKNFNINPAKVIVARLGTTAKGNAMQGRNGKLNLVSCCVMLPVKRMDRIVDALRRVKKTEVNWVHIGDGPLMHEIRESTCSLPANVTARFTGRLSADDVLTYYSTNQVDLFINTSESEGVPVSVMEALSASIPVMATDVGGTHEIVDDSVGKLLPAFPDADTIANELEWYSSLPTDEKARYKERAYLRYRERCDATEWAKFLLGQLCN